MLLPLLRCLLSPPHAHSCRGVHVKSAPKVTAESWAIVDARTGDTLWGKRPTAVRGVASLTKILNALATIRWCNSVPPSAGRRYSLVTISAQVRQQRLQPAGRWGVGVDECFFRRRRLAEHRRSYNQATL